MPSSMGLCRLVLIASVGLMAACADKPQIVAGPGAHPDAGVVSPATPLAPLASGSLELVETWPVETSLDNPDLADAHEVWLQMIDGAKTSLDFEEFYGATAEGSRLEPILAAIERAATRGVKVRFIFDSVFYARESAVPDRLRAISGVEVAIIDIKALTGGVQHAKFFIVDGREVFVGSQNFDWRSLTHVQELGVRTDVAALVAPVVGVFDLDWKLAAGAALAEARAQAGTPSPNQPVDVVYGAGRTSAWVGLSPDKLLSDAQRWDLPRIVAWLDGAKQRVRVQVMSYATQNYDGSTFTGLDEALRRAAARGVKVELMVADWSKKPKAIGVLQELQRLDNVTVKLVTIPQWSGGFVPYARVIHSKLMSVDGARAWVGTSNWSGDYFTKSRNLGFFFEGGPVVADVDAFFERTWASSYATVVDPEAHYEAPRVHK